jgi:uncharacterized protein
MDGGLEFEWDPTKAEANFRKHGVSFEQAMGVFYDPRMVTVEDDRFAYGELREVAFGRIEAGVLAVVYVERRENLIRIISARLATALERRRYEHG